MSGKAKYRISVGTVATLWAAVIAYDIIALRHGWAVFTPLHSTCLAVLITASLAVVVVGVCRGPSFYKAFRAGKATGREEIRRAVANGRKPHGYRGEISGEIHVLG